MNRLAGRQASEFDVDNPGLVLLGRDLVGRRWPLACHGNFFSDGIQSGELERRIVDGTRLIEHADFQSSAIRQRLQKPDGVVSINRGLSIRGRRPGQLDEGLVVDLVVDLNFPGA